MFGQRINKSHSGTSRTIRSSGAQKLVERHLYRNKLRRFHYGIIFQENPGLTVVELIKRVNNLNNNTIKAWSTIIISLKFYFFQFVLFSFKQISQIHGSKKG